MQENEIRERLEKAVGGEERFASTFSNRTMRDTRARARRELDDGVADYLAVRRRVDEALEKEKLPPLDVEAVEILSGRYVAAWSAYQHAGARTANWAVTGPARFPVERNRKRMDTESKRLGELVEFVKLAPSRAVKAAKLAAKRAIGTAGVADLELEDLRTRLEKREAAQARMKETNAIIRKLKLGENDAEKLAVALREAGFEVNPNLAGIILRPPYNGAPGGYQAWQLTNNLSEVKRLRARVADVAAKIARMEAAADEPASRTVNGIEIVEDVAEDRLRLIFSGRPSPMVIAALKARGFRWSPRAGAWQRQLTANARAAAETIVTLEEPATA